MSFIRKPIPIVIRKTITKIVILMVVTAAAELKTPRLAGLNITSAAEMISLQKVPAKMAKVPATASARIQDNKAKRKRNVHALVL